jgi:hypothetical protein
VRAGWRPIEVARCGSPRLPSGRSHTGLDAALAQLTFRDFERW